MDTGKLVQGFFPKQADIDKVLKITQRKVLRGTCLLLTMNTGRISISQYFKDIHLYLAQNKLHNTEAAIRKVETLAERYILLD